jgi:hypothetical protein
MDDKEDLVLIHHANVRLGMALFTTHEKREINAG